MSEPLDQPTEPDRPAPDTRRWRDRLRDLVDGAARESALHYPVRLVLLLAQRFVSERLLVRASSLAFFTILSLVPMLVVAVSTIVAFGGKNSDDSSRTLDQLEGLMLPGLGPEVSQYAVEALERATTGGIGAVGVLVLVFTAVMLFFHVERVFNDTWHATERRPVYVRVLLFYSLMTLGPLLLSVSLYHAAALADAVDVGVVSWLTASITPFVVNAAIFLIIFKLVPNTLVRWRYAIISAFLTSIAFELAKIGFGIYAHQTMSGEHNVIYGPLVILPTFLVWVYVSWMVVLVGNQVAYCMQHMESLSVLDARERARMHVEAFVGSSLVALEVFAPIARAFDRGLGPLPHAVICTESGQHQRAVAEILDTLVDAGLVLEVECKGSTGYLPARSPADITVREILAPFEQMAGGNSAHEPSPELEAVLSRVRGAQAAAVDGLTAQDLYARSEARA